MKQAPTHRQGARIAEREDRHRTILFKMTTAEYDNLRRVAHHLGYSMSHTCRMLIEDRVASLWPNEDERPNVLEMDIEKEQRKVAATEATARWIQRSRNATQKKEMKLRQEAEWAKEKQAKLKAREEAILAKLNGVEATRAIKRAGSRKMYREIDAEKLHAHKVQKEMFNDVTKALAKEALRLGRPLSESEKWEIGKGVRASVGGADDAKMEEAVARAVLDKERKLKRKLTVRESWDVRDAVRNR